MFGRLDSLVESLPWNKSMASGREILRASAGTRLLFDQERHSLTTALESITIEVVQHDRKQM